jgi:hypothetical protein
VTSTLFARRLIAKHPAAHRSRLCSSSSPPPPSAQHLHQGPVPTKVHLALPPHLIIAHIDIHPPLGIVDSFSRIHSDSRWTFRTRLQAPEEQTRRRNVRPSWAPSSVVDDDTPTRTSTHPHLQVRTRRRPIHLVSMSTSMRVCELQMVHSGCGIRLGLVWSTRG